MVLPEMQIELSAIWGETTGTLIATIASNTVSL